LTANLASVRTKIEHCLPVEQSASDSAQKGDDMKKPVNKVALALWILAALFVVGELWSLGDMFQSAARFHQDEIYLIGGSIERIVQSIVGTAALLTALGVLIELVDQIRWTVVRATDKS
jgi:hypothetical protein